MALLKFELMSTGNTDFIKEQGGAEMGAK
uniref:Uncharacterized protein n=1 Tax=Anguilla anguilla TaxID=7936 RepID=A0A0E9VNJ4_ANGAN